MIEGETRFTNTQSYVEKNGEREQSYGFCQMHIPSHPYLANDRKYFSDPYYQLELCCDQWKKNPWKFYGYKNNYQVSTNSYKWN